MFYGLLLLIVLINTLCYMKFSFIVNQDISLVSTHVTIITMQQSLI